METGGDIVEINGKRFYRGRYKITDENAGFIEICMRGLSGSDGVNDLVRIRKLVSEGEVKEEGQAMQEFSKNFNYSMVDDEARFNICLPVKWLIY